MKQKMLSRRNFIKTALVSGTGLAAMGLVGCSSSSSSSSSSSESESSASEAAETEVPASTVVELEDDFDYSDWLDDQGRTKVITASPADPGTFDPFGTPATAALDVTMFEGLFYVNPVTFEIEPCMAKNYEMSDDGLDVTVEIYDYIKDSVGNPITSSDIKWCYDSYKESGKANSSGIDNVEIIDDYNFILHLSSSQVGIWTNTCQFDIMSQSAYESAENFGLEPIATGPYVLTDYVVGSSYTYEKNEDYWQTDEDAVAYICKTNVDVVEFDVIKEPSQMTIALELGNADLVNDLSYTEASRFMEGGEDEGTHNVFTYESILAQLLYLNMSDDSIFVDDKELRMAVLHSINREDLIEGASDGYGSLCYTFGCEAGSLGFLEKWYDEEYFTYDTDYAKECLANSNYDGTSIRIVSNNTDLKKAISQLIQMMLENVGITAEVITYEDALFNTYKNDSTQWDILLDNTSAGAEISSMWRRKFDPANFSNDQGGANFMHDDELTALLYECIDMATYSEETVDAYHQALKESYSCMGLYNALCFNVCSKVVTESATNDTGHLLTNVCTFVWNE